MISRLENHLLNVPPEDLTEIQKWQIALLLLANDFRYWLTNAPNQFRARIWNAGILLWWYRLWVRLDEFDKSLNFDAVAYSVMSARKRRWYDEDLAVRKRIAHNRDMQGDGPKLFIFIRDIVIGVK